MVGVRWRLPLSGFSFTRDYDAGMGHVDAVTPQRPNGPLPALADEDGARDQSPAVVIDYL